MVIFISYIHDQITKRISKQMQETTLVRCRESHKQNK